MSIPLKAGTIAYSTWAHYCLGSYCASVSRVEQARRAASSTHGWLQTAMCLVCGDCSPPVDIGYFMSRATAKERRADARRLRVYARTLVLRARGLEG